jgi:uncharacterized protein with GYD domain
MPKYLLQVSYTSDGVKGLRKEGGTSRRAAAEQLIKSLGGTMECFYYAFGEHDAVTIVEFPDHASMSAAALVIGASGAVTGKTTVLITPEEVDAAVKKTPTYRAPGQ